MAVRSSFFSFQRSFTILVLELKSQRNTRKSLASISNAKGIHEWLWLTFQRRSLGQLPALPLAGVQQTDTGTRHAWAPASGLHVAPPLRTLPPRRLHLAYQRGLWLTGGGGRAGPAGVGSISSHCCEEVWKWTASWPNGREVRGWHEPMRSGGGAGRVWKGPQRLLWRQTRRVAVCVHGSGVRCRHELHR